MLQTSQEFVQWRPIQTKYWNIKMDEMSKLANEFETVSTSDNQLYKEVKVEGKGACCIATKEVKKGILILREAPQLLYPVQNQTPTFEENFEQLLFCINAFTEMSKKDQTSYLELYNKFEDDKNTWSTYMEQHFSALKDMVKKMPIPNMKQEEAFKVIAIMDTNGFHNGVCLKMSRFNHSCRPNAQYFWNEDTNTRDMRTLRKIKQGEEITVSYIGSLLFSREKRYAYLKDTYNFDCRCEACDLTEEEIEQEVKRFDEYKAEMLRKQEYRDAAKVASNRRAAQALTLSELRSLKNMYKIAKEIRTFSRIVILRSIIEVAFDASVQGALNAGCSESAKTTLMKEAKMFSDIGLKLATTLYGADHSETREWRERSVEPIKFFLKNVWG